jgi:hypothetical protein
LEEILDRLLLRAMAVDQILGRAAKDDLASYADGSILFESYRRFLLISVVEDDRDTSLGDTRLASFVYKILRSMLLFDRLCCE